MGRCRISSMDGKGGGGTCKKGEASQGGTKFHGGFPVNWFPHDMSSDCGWIKARSGRCVSVSAKAARLRRLGSAVKHLKGLFMKGRIAGRQDVPCAVKTKGRAGPVCHASARTFDHGNNRAIIVGRH